jgi:PqqD family protein of HPr-rel-A system
VADAKYSTDALTGFRICPLDSLTAYYHRRSGVTHVVADPVPQILSVLHDKILSVDALMSALISENDLTIEKDTRAALSERLDELCTVGLVLRT